MNQSKHRWWIVILSVGVPICVAILFRFKIRGYDLSFFPYIYATINGLTACLLIVAVMAIKRGKRRLHKQCMIGCIVLSAIFLIMYTAYHMTTEATLYGGKGTMRYVYYGILASHVFFSVFVVPIVLFTLSHALSGNFKQHKNLAKYSFPIWLYVAVTGVLVFVMISPYY